MVCIFSFFYLIICRIICRVYMQCAFALLCSIDILRLLCLFIFYRFLSSVLVLFWQKLLLLCLSLFYLMRVILFYMPIRAVTGSVFLLFPLIFFILVIMAVSFCDYMLCFLSIHAFHRIYYTVICFIRPMQSHFYPLIIWHKIFSSLPYDTIHVYFSVIPLLFLTCYILLSWWLFRRLCLLSTICTALRWWYSSHQWYIMMRWLHDLLWNKIMITYCGCCMISFMIWVWWVSFGNGMTVQCTSLRNRAWPYIVRSWP